jgi:hypothetical protein
MTLNLFVCSDLPTNMVVLHSYVRIFIEPLLDTQWTERQGERGIWVVVCCYLL